MPLYLDLIQLVFSLAVATDLCSEEVKISGGHHENIPI